MEVLRLEDDVDGEVEDGAAVVEDVQLRVEVEPAAVGQEGQLPRKDPEMAARSLQVRLLAAIHFTSQLFWRKSQSQA